MATRPKSAARAPAADSAAPAEREPRAREAPAPARREDGAADRRHARGERSLRVGRDGLEPVDERGAPGVGELEALLPVVVAAVEAEHVAGDLHRRVEAAVLALREHAGDLQLLQPRRLAGLR